MCNISSSKHSAYSGLNKYLCFLAQKFQIHTFTSNHNVHKSWCGLCFWAPYLLIDRYYKNLSIKGFAAQIRRPRELL